MSNREILDRLPPHSIEAERAVLGSIILDPSVCNDVGLIVAADDFYAATHSCLFRHLMEMHDQDLDIDTTLLIEQLRKSGDLEQVGGLAGLAEIVQSVAVAAHAVHYAEIVRDKARLRKLSHVAIEMLRDAYDDESPAEEILARADHSLQAAACGSYREPTTPAYQAMVNAWEVMKARQCGEPLVRTGLSTIDARLGGLFPGELIILAARPSVGKTALATQIAVNAAIQDKRVLFASMEMSPGELMSRVIAGHAHVDLQKIRTGQIDEEEERRFIDAASRYKDMALDIQPEGDLTRVSDIRRVANILNRQKDRPPLSLVVVDYLQLLDPDDLRLPRQEQVSRQSRALKRLARSMNIPVLCLSQLNRAIERDKGRRPNLADLRESGAIEQDADVVMFIHRKMGSDDERERNSSELIIAKNRSGEVGMCPLQFDGASTSFRVPAPERFSEFDAWDVDSDW